MHTRRCTGNWTAAVEKTPAAVRSGRGLDRQAKHTKEGLGGGEEDMGEGERGSKESQSNKVCGTGAFSISFEVY
jgi:hypothetical protein